MRVPRRILFPLAALVGLGLGSLASSCGHQPGFPFRPGAEYGDRLAERIDHPTPPPVYETPPREWLWTVWLPDFLPAVSACMAATESPDAVATQAWPVKSGVVGVHLRDPDGTRWTCTAPAQGMTVTSLDRLPSEASPEGPVFARLGDTPPRGCGPATPATTATGRQIGWLMPGPC